MPAAELRRAASARYPKDLRWIKVGMALVGWLSSACGSSSDNALFGNAGEAVCSPTARCGSPATGGIGGVHAQGGAVNGGNVSASGGEGGSGAEVGAGGTSAGGDDGAGGDLGAGGLGTGGFQSVTCPQGGYHAVLTGPYRSGLGSNDIGATIDFSVTASGTVMGSFTGRGTAKATVTGSLDCASGVLSARIENGSYNLGLQMTRFSGSFDGTYDPSTSSFDGTWTITESGAANNGGTGPWTTR
jgi:hypothetical protein